MRGAKATSYICTKTALSSSPAVMPRGPRNSSLKSSVWRATRPMCALSQPQALSHRCHRASRRKTQAGHAFRWPTAGSGPMQSAQ